MSRSSATASAPGWVFFGGVPWDTPWLNDQHLAHAMAAEAPVIYVEPARSPLTGFHGARAGRGRPPGLRSVMRPGVRRAEGGVTVLTTVALPKVGSPLSQRLSAPLVRAQVRAAVSAHLGPAPVLAAVAMGAPARLLKASARERAFVAFVSDWLEAGSRMLRQKRSVIAQASRALWESADLLCVTSRRLQEALDDRDFASHLVPHGFDQAVVADYVDPPRPPEYNGSQGPIMVVAGRLNSRLDIDLLGSLAARPGQLFLVGPIMTRDRPAGLTELLERPDVHHLGPRRREELPAYLVHADVQLIPYVADEWSEYASPMKIWDYLYAGPPIVGHGCPALEDLGEPIAFHGTTHEAVHAAIDRALAARDQPALARRRRAIAEANTWSSRAAQLRELVQAHVG